MATQNGNADVVDGLLEKGAAVNVVHQTGFTPLMYAAAADHADAAARLLAAGASISSRDKQDQTPLIIAAINNSVRVSKLLIIAGADPEEKNRKGFSARQYAEASGRPDFIRLFTKKDAPGRS